MIQPNVAAALLWAVWVIGWILSARFTSKSVHQQPGASQLRYRLFTRAGAILVFFHPVGEGALTQPLLGRETWIGWTGVMLVLAGLGFASWARFHLGRLWSGRVTLKENHAIVRTGPYALVRHPIYTGLVLALVGTALIQFTVVAAIGLVLAIIGLVIKIGQEEQLLTEHFGGGYDAYRADVKGLIPYVW